MAFLSPLFLIGAAAAAIPLVLHLLKREPEVRLRFAPVKLLMHAPVEHAEKRHLRELLLLALRMAALVLLALAFARPFFASGEAAMSGTTIVALDRSYSMSSPARFEQAKQLARDAIAKAPPLHAVGVVVFDDAAEVIASPAADRSQATGAIDQVSPGSGSTRYRAGLSAAAQQLAGRPGSIVVVTDLQASGWGAGDRVSVPGSTTIEIVDTGPLPDNLAVVALAATPDRLVASIRNTGARQREARARLTLDDRPAGESVVAIGPGSLAEVSFPRASAGTAGVSIDDAEGLQADNVRYAVFGAGRPRVAVVTSSGDLGRDAYYARAALEASAPNAESYEAVGVAAADLTSWDSARMAEHVAVVLLSTRGLERRGRELLGEYVRRGGGLLVAAGPDLDGAVMVDALGSEIGLRIAADAAAAPDRRTLAPADLRHPVFEPFGANAAALGLVQFRQVASVSGGACRPLARFTTGETALLDCPAGQGRALVLASDLDNRWNDFPLHATFVPFLHEAVEYLAAAHGRRGEYLVGQISHPDGRRPGIVALSVTQEAGAAPRRVAVNVDPAEGDPARMSAEDFQAAVTRLKEEAAPAAAVEAPLQEDRQRLWQYALLLTLVVLLAEGVVAGRTA
jgi:hypothetical protein